MLTLKHKFAGSGIRIDRWNIKLPVLYEILRLYAILQHFLNEGTVYRVNVELYREIKRNGGARCVKGALTRFAELSPMLRPNKCRAYAHSLVPPLLAIVRRPEENVQDALTATAPAIFETLGRFFKDEECKVCFVKMETALSRQINKTASSKSETGWEIYEGWKYGLLRGRVTGTC